MQFALSDEQQMLVGTVRRFIDTELLPLEENRARRSPHPARAKEIFEKSRALGFYAMNIPEQYGGGGVTQSIRCWSRSSSAARRTF
jgi:acyl-CoA dehydrogenase